MKTRENITQPQTTEAVPDPAAMIETFRAIGYSPETAVADIIDNSISAGAKNIRINFEWKGSETTVAIEDDGCGMNNVGLINAMRPGSKNPTDPRGPNDLGRFGMGLKTASFSQCKQLTVISKMKADDLCWWTWSLDHIAKTKKWELVKTLPDGFDLEKYNQLKQGTVVIWAGLDRMLKDTRQESKEARYKFDKIMEQVEIHISMVFHRFLEKKQVRIWFQDRELTAWDPYYRDSQATQYFPEETISNGRVTIKGYVLPHISKISNSDFKRGEGLRGWNDHQGFYVYRNNRLLVSGDWLQFFRKEEHHKLARISVDLGNDLDEEWQIDIKKSTARAPISLRDKLKAIAQNVRKQAVEVYRHKGRVIQRNFREIELQQLWLEKVRHGKRFYEINRDHPIVRYLMEKCLGGKELNNLLKFIEETVPVPLIMIRENENPEVQAQPFEHTDTGLVSQLMQTMYENLIAQGKSPENAKAIVLNIEPFNLYPHLLTSIS